MPHGHSFASQGRAQDTLRWGGRTGLTIQNPAGGAAAALAKALANAQGQQGKQLVNAHWKWPLTWNTLVCIRPIMAPDETGSVIVNLAFTIGSGDAQQTFIASYTVAGPGPYLSTIDTSLYLPACDVMVAVDSMGVPNEGGGPAPLNTTGTDVLEVGVFVAPFTEPHSALHLLEGFARDERFEQGDRDGGWMPPGFNPETLGYKR